MKKLVKTLSVFLASALIFTGCASNSAKTTAGSGSGEKKTTKLVVGATPVPHAEILNEVVKPLLKEKGIDLEVKEFTDYVTPNTALNDKQIDANFFQHVPYMEDFAAKNNMKLVAAAKVHVEPLGAYSKKITSKDQIKDKAVVAIPNDATNEGRALLLLQKQGFIKLKDPNGLTQTPKDIVENPKNLQFKELEAAQLPRVLQDVDFAIINTNYALEAKLNPTKDSLFIEDKDSPYANVLTVRPDNEKDPAIQELVKALNSPEVKKFIEDKYQGSIVPAF
ncbi:MetQ/NlpA family ABC transporter substrate-binding protein [Fonticella tunisiensis]|uniref:Lipoprotein n=1 Tax=Fonticella tunisiensis TaxID=1096341 RepID=A0A4R7KBQ5_9CLOT|nr:MetQ/NlpA family ABC transporter substrate-binding protein [Fonticella tunisiensis]TDT52097.1 D-methionine transport system substrate-binding protein [Fonticella tunisiensis]